MKEDVAQLALKVEDRTKHCAMTRYQNLWNRIRSTPIACVETTAHANLILVSFSRFQTLGLWNYMDGNQQTNRRVVFNIQVCGDESYWHSRSSSTLPFYMYYRPLGHKHILTFPLDVENKNNPLPLKKSTTSKSGSFWWAVLAKSPEHIEEDT